MFLLIGLLYLLLCCPIVIRIMVGINGSEGGVRADISYLGVCMCYHQELSWKDALAYVKSLLFERRQNWKKRGEDPGRRIKTGRSQQMLFRLHAAGRFEQLDLKARVGLADAAQTAVAVGACRAVFSSILSALTGGKRCVCVAADFERPCFCLDMRCIFSVSPGDMMLAAARAALIKKRREGSGWKSIPLRA